MAINTDDQAINEAKATRGSGRKTKTNAVPKEVDTGAGVSQLQQKLDVARESVATATESYVMGGVAIGLQRIASGNFGSSTNAIFEVLDDFTESVLGLESDSRFQLPPASEPKKMLAAADVINVT